MRSVGKVTCFVINCIIGAVSTILFFVFYSFTFDANNDEHSIQLGLFSLLYCSFIAIVPNILFYHFLKHNKVQLLLYQIIPFVLGGGSYIILQIAIL